LVPPSRRADDSVRFDFPRQYATWPGEMAPGRSRHLGSRHPRRPRFSGRRNRMPFPAGTFRPAGATILARLDRLHIGARTPIGMPRLPQNGSWLAPRRGRKCAWLSASARDSRGPMMFFSNAALVEGCAGKSIGHQPINVDVMVMFARGSRRAAQTSSASFFMRRF